MSIDYQLVRSSRRRTVSIQIKSGQVRVLAPDYVDKAWIEAFVQKKAQWITSKLTQFNAHQAQFKPLQFVEGESLYFLGDKLSLVIMPLLGNAKKTSVSQEPGKLIVNLPAKVYNSPDKALIVKQAISNWYIEQANRILPQRFALLQQQVGLSASQLQIKYYKSRWGSCDAKRRIKLNWLLVMTPPFVLDYVIIHELCHLKHLNHSAKFWALVNQHTPDHESAKRWLKQHQQALYWQ